VGIFPLDSVGEHDGIIHPAWGMMQ
jgi:hypothetical protein